MYRLFLCTLFLWMLGGNLTAQTSDSTVAEPEISALKTDQPEQFLYRSGSGGDGLKGRTVLRLSKRPYVAEEKGKITFKSKYYKVPKNL